jgi:hypothetical protein
MERFLGALGRRDFWRFRTVQALTGAALTVSGAAEALFVNERIGREMEAIEGAIAAASQRQGAIDQALFQLRFSQINGITLGVLSVGDSVRPELRQSLLDLQFVVRQMPTEIMLQQLHAGDAAAFAADRQTYLDLIAAAKADSAVADWDAVNAFEFDREGRLFDLQQATIGYIGDLETARRNKQAEMDFAVRLGFALQQIGFVVVLLSGLIHQHQQRAAAAAVRPSEPTSGAAGRL